MRPTQTLELAVEQGYVVCRGSMTVTNSFYDYCKRTDTPYIVVRNKTKFASIKIDLIGQSYEMSGQACQEIHDILMAHHVGKWKRVYANKHSTLMFSDKIPVEDSAEVAGAIVSIMSKPGYRRTRYL